MKYIRQFTRKQERNHTKTLEQQKYDLDLARKVLTAVTAFSFIGNPFAAMASTVTRVDGTKVDFQNNVGNIYAEKIVNNNTAVNRFQDFKIDAGDIANMYFKTDANSKDLANNLVNFVNSRIDVAGTVNAIKDSKIGGNLFFLSSNGMAVTGSGVINAGSLYVMTPTQSYMESIMTGGVLNDLTFNTMLAPIVDTSRWQEIPVNASGTITILGKVNATNEVKMRAAKIGVGKNVDDEAVDDVAAGGVNATNAAIKTGVTDFADIVKLTDEQQKAAGITALTATMAENSGDIVLEAYVDNKSDVNPVETVPIVGNSNIINGLVSWGENAFKNQTFNSSVDIYGEVNAAGKADITAKAVNSNAELNEQGNYVSNGNKDVAQLADVNANVNISGTVTAAKDVTVKAEALNRYIDNTGAIAKGVSLAVSSGTPLTGDAAYSKLDTDASVTIEQGATVKSVGGSVDIDAKAETLAASAASTMGLKFKTVGGYTGTNVPAGAVVYTEAENDAKVTVNGTVTAKNDVNINADADLTVEAENKMTVTGEKANQFVLGVTLANVENNADVTIGGEGSSVTATDGNLAVNAKATSDFTSKTSISAGESSAVGIAVNVTEFDSGANVTVDTDLEAGKDLIVNADDTVEADNVIAESKVGSGKYMSSATQIMQQNGSIDGVKGFFSGITNRLGLSLGGDDIKNKLSVGDVLKAGATVTYSGQNHNSNVTIGNDANLNAGGKLDVDAKTLIKDAHFAATGATYSYNDATSASIDLNAAVLVTNMNNSSSVVVEDAATDNDGKEHKAQLQGSGGVDINASTRFEYNRVDKMKEAVEDAAAQIEHAFTTLGDAFEEDLQAIPDGFNEKIKSYKSAYSAFKSAMEDVDVDGQQLAGGQGLTDDNSNVLNAIVQGYRALTALEELNAMLDENNGSEVMQNASEAFKGASDLFSSALAFIDPNSYGTFAAASVSKGSSGDSGGSAPGGGSVTGAVGGTSAAAVNGAGAVMVNDVNSVSKIEIGRDAVITSSRDVNVGAENFMEDVSLGGLNLGLFNNAGGGTSASIGATVNYAEFNTDTIVAINDGTGIIGGNIDIDAQNTIDHVSVAASAGKGPSSQTESSGVVLNGMLSFVNGSSDILTAVDDGAKLTANQNEYKETVDSKEETKKTEGNISITGHNNANITNVAAGAAWGKGSAAVGVGLAYTDFDVKNITGVADVAQQIEGLYATDREGHVNSEDLEEAKKKFSNTYTKEAAGKEKGGITAYDFNIDAATDGSIQSVSAAGTLSNDDASGQIGFFDKISSGLNSLDQKLVGKNGLVDTVSSSFLKTGQNGEKMNDFFTMGKKTHGVGNTTTSSDGITIVNPGVGTNNINTFMPSFSLAGSGSVSVNMLDNATEAIVDNAKITINQAAGQEKGDITVTARDALYAGAYSGAAALQWNSGGSSSDRSVSVSGAAGVNDIANTVKATIKNSTISGAGKVDTMALSGGQQLALGLGMAVVKADGTTGYSGNAAVSVNLIDHDVDALQENNTVTNTDDVNVYAYARDIENTGGGGLTVGQQKVGVGATVGVAQLHNNISAGIKGGMYTDVESVDVQALNALQNITVGVAAGVTVPPGDGGSANVQGAGVYNEVHNITNAFIKGSDKEHKAVITTKDGGTVNVVAQDTTKNSDLELRLDGLADGRETIMKVFGSLFSLGAKNYYEGIDTSAAGEEIKLDKDSGSSIITVAGSIAGTSGKAAVGGAVAITDIENNYTADVDYADITAETLTADAGSDSNIVTVAGGAAVAGKGSGVGSVSWNDVENIAEVNIDNSVIKAQKAEAIAKNTAQIVSITGQISGGKEAAVGAALGYIGLDNSTEANITNTTFDKRDATENDGITVIADAQNGSDSYNIGAGVSAAGKAAVSGTVVVTQTHGTAGAVMDTVAINNAKAVTANAVDDTDILSVIGTTIAGKAAVGAGVAYTEIGDVSTDTEDGQYVTAEIKNSTINTMADSTVDVTAKDTARVINVAVGIGGAANAAVQGASATTLINKTTSAEMNNTSVDGTATDSKNANVTVDAQNDSEITSSADTVSVAAQGAGVGAGIAVNRIIQQTNAAVNGGTMNVNNLTVKADATPRIENIGIGGGIAGEGAGISGSVAVNMIQNDATAHIGSGATIVADGSVGVVATSDEQIANYAGQAAVGGVGAGVGVSVSVNQIAGTTSATVGGEKEAETNVTAKGAKGNDSLTTDTKIDVDSEINDKLIDGDTVGMDAVIDRTDEERSGLIVDASSTRDLKSFLITAGVAGEGAGVAGTVNVNQIAGSTDAGITNTNVNANITEAGNVTVNAGDYSNMSGFVGSVGVGGVGAGAGLASDTNTISRNVNAAVDDSDIKADTFELDADSAQGVSSFSVGAGAAGIGGGAAGVVTVTELNNTTQTMLNNSKVSADTVNIKANHTGIVNAGNVSVGGAGLGVGGGLSVGVLKDNSTTAVTVKGDNPEEDTITASGDVTIAAANTATVNPMISANGVGAFGGIAGATSINNLNSKVVTTIEGVGITSAGGNISGTADNTFNVEAYMGTVSGGVVGVGAGVTVNTIDSTVQTNVNGSTLDAAKDITLTADETRNITQTATNVAAGGVAAGANIAVTTVGKEIADEETKKKVSEANNVFGDNAGLLTADAESALATAGIENYTPHVDAKLGGNKESQITVNISGSKLIAGDTVKAEATETDNINMTLGSGVAGQAAVNAGVGILDVNRNVGVNITGGGITADTIEIGTDIDGAAKLEVYQGTAGLYGANAAVGTVHTTGNSKIDMDDVSLAGNTINVTAGDHSAADVNVLGITVGAVSVGAIVATAENEGSTEVEITNSESAGKDEDASGSITISTDKANTITAHATGGTGGVLSGSGVVATASDSGASQISLGAENGQGHNSFIMHDITIAASAKPAVTAIADSISVGFAGTAGASVATASANGSVLVNVYDGNTLSADTVDVTADAGTQEGKNTAEAKVEGNSGGGYAAVAANAATATTDMNANVTIGEVAYKEKEVETIIGYTYEMKKDENDNDILTQTPQTKKTTVGATALHIGASNTAKTVADARGVTVGLGFSSGNNIATTKNTSTTNITLKGSNKGTLLGSLDIAAAGAGDNKATADGSGGGLVGADFAAVVDNDMTSNVTVDVTGSLKVNGDISIEALQNDTANINADALKATVVGLSGTKAENTIGGETKINLGADIDGSGSLDVNAANTITFGNTEEYAVEGSGYGGINAQGADFTNSIEKTASLNITGKQIVTAGAQTYEAKTTGDITAGGYIKAAGLGSFTWVTLDNDLTVHDNITVGSDSFLKTTEAESDIVLAAVDNVDVTVRGVADVQGAAVGGASSDVDNTLMRDNAVTVNGDIYSMNDVSLFAGKDKIGNDGTLNVSVESETYNYAGIPLAASPKLSDDITQNNRIVVGTGSDISSVRNIDLYADAGKETIRDATLLYTWVYSDRNEGYTSSTIGDKEADNKKSDNYVQVDGALTAGVQNKQYITIGGTYNPETGETTGAQLVFFDPAVLEGVKAYSKEQESAAVGINGVSINASDNVNKDDIVFEQFDYGLALFERYNELGELMNSYGEDKNSTAYLGYQAERQRIFQQLDDMHLLEEMKDAQGNIHHVPVEGAAKIDSIALPDIIASGGNINIQTDNLTGGGELTAQGSPEVVINNNTNLYLKVNDVIVGDAGGEINYNNVNIISDGAVSQIQSMNADAGKMAAFSSVVADAGDGQSKLVINGNYGGDDILAKVNIDGKEEVISTLPRADIEINGNVSNANGLVQITSKANNIVIQGENAASSAGVTGKEVHLTASNGSISQGFQEGIVNIGGSVQEQYRVQYEEWKDWFNEEYKGSITNSSSDGGEDQSAIQDEHDIQYGDKKDDLTGNRISGENIYISASDININGAIQSGYADYILDIGSDVQNDIERIQKNWQQNGGEALSDAIVTTGDTYKIVVGGNRLEGGAYVRYVDAYYNPSTGKIVVPNVDANGGKVYLTGRISSTGGGSIKVLDGAYDITVANETGVDLQLGKLVSNDVEGLISITDTAKNTVTEITRDKTIYKDLNEWNAETGDWTITREEDAALATYTPEDGLRYNWTTGQNLAESLTYRRTIKAGLWGLVETMDDEALKEYEQTTNPIDFSQGSSNKLNGEYIGNVNEIDANKDFAVIFDNKVLNNTVSGPGEPKRWSSGFLGWFKWEEYTWTRHTGTSQQYVASVKADKPIYIGFIGNADGYSTIGVTSKGSVDLTGTIGSANGGTNSLISIITTDGSINQLGGTLNGDNIDLTAQMGMNDINITSIGDDVALKAVNNGSGDVTITVNGAYGKDGNVILDSVTTTSGAVSLTADGDITQKGTNVSVSADRIDLISHNGSVGTDGQALIVHGGQQVTDSLNSLSASVNVSADGNINLVQESGDLRIGRIYSETGDVMIAVTDGNLVDALPDGEVVDRGNTDELIQKWEDLGLIQGEGENNYTAKIEQDVADFISHVENEFSLYQDMKAYYATNEGAETDGSYQALLERYGQYGTADEYLQKNSEAQSHIENLQEAEKDYWSKEQLLYAISDNIINPDSSTTDKVVKDPNLKGNNITVVVHGGSAGLNSDKTTVIGVSDLTDVANLQALANASASNVTWDAAKEEFTITDKLPLGIQSSGAIHIETDGNAYLAGRTEDNAVIENQLNIDLINAADGKGNITLQGHDGIYNVHNGDDAAIIGNDLVIQGGENGSIGTDERMMNVALNGTLQAQSKGSIYVNQLGGDLELVSVGAGEDIILQASRNIVNSGVTLAGGAEGQITSEGQGVISLVAGGSIGSTDAGLNIEANGAIVNAQAEGDISLEGSGDGGTLVLGTISGENLNVHNEKGSVALGRTDDEGEDAEVVEGSIATAGDAVITAKDNIELSDGTISVNAGAGELTLTAENGSVTQNASLEGSDTGIYAATVNVSSKGSQLLENANNVVTNFVVHGLEENNSLTGDVHLVSNAGTVNIDFSDDEDNGITVNNGSIDVYHTGANGLNVTGSATTQKTDGSEEAADINFHSNEGAIHVDGTMTAGDSFTAVTDSGAITLKGDVTAHNGDVEATTQSGAIEFGGSVSAAQGSITANTQVGEIRVTGQMTAGQDINLTSGAGAITVLGGAAAGSHFSAATQSGDVTIGEADEAGIVTGDVTAEKGTVNVSTNSGSVTVNGAVWSGTDTTFHAGGTEEAAGDITVNGAVHADSAVTAETTVGSIFFGGTTDAGTGITFTSNVGNISTTGSLTTANGDVSAKTGSGTITLGGDVTANGGSVTAHTGSGDVSVSGKADASQDIDLSSDGGDITVKGSATAGSNFSAATGRGGVTLGGTVTAEAGKVLAQTGSGMIQVEGDVYSDLDTELQAGITEDDTGSIIVKGEIASGKEVHASATNGNIRFEGITTASAGDVTATVSGDGDITFNGAVTAVSEGDAGGNIAATVSGTGNITTDRDAVFKADKDIQFTTNVGNITANSAVTAGEDIVFKVLTEGNMTLRDDLKSEQNIDLNVNSGNILFEGTQDGVHEDIYVTSNGGDVTVSINEGGSGVIKDTNSEGPTGDWAHLTSAEGNVTVRHDGIGDVDLYELYAKQDAGVSVANGNLHLVDVSGNLVAVFVKSEGKEMDVENIEAAQQIAISGSNMDLDSIKQREDGDGFLVITPEGTADDQPIDNLVIGDILTNGGVRFDHLWLNTGNIHVSEGALHLDKVYVQDKATFSTDDMTTNVFGSAPVYDDSVSSSYWVNTSINSPKDDLAAWNSDELNDKWMHIFFSPEGTVQISNGNLLHLADHNYVYNQRYSQVDWMNLFTDEDFYNFYDKYYAPDLSYHERYGLTSGSGHSVENAEEDEVIVE